MLDGRPSAQKTGLPKAARYVERWRRKILTGWRIQGPLPLVKDPFFSKMLMKESFTYVEADRDQSDRSARQGGGILVESTGRRRNRSFRYDTYIEILRGDMGES